MARLIPKVAIDEISLKPERDVARVLVEKLPNDCIVYHSYPWLKPERNDRGTTTYLQEGEADFVVIVPSHGLLVLEVKGGEIGYEAGDRDWYRKTPSNPRKRIKDPFEQARKATHYLTNEIKEIGYPGLTSLPFTFGYAVIFPDCEYRGAMPPGADASILLSTRDLPYLDRRVTEILNHWCRISKPRALEKNDLEIIQRAITPAFQLLPVLFRQIEEQEEKLFRLTKEQMVLLKFLAQRDRAAIEGVAGSGKTMLARAQAQGFADAGRRTLLLCYNKALAGWLRQSIPDTYNESITVRHFHGLCREWCNRAGMSFAPPRTGRDRFWREQAPGMLLDALDMLPDRFDAVVVDESQDFQPDWWMPLELINAGGEEGPMYVFYDPAQNLFVSDRLSMPALGQPFPLPTNCRNTRRIATVCGKILDLNIPTHQNAPEGTVPQVVVAAGAEAQKSAASKLLGDWIRRGSLSPAQVAVLCPNRWENSSFWDITRLGKIDLTDDLDRWRNGDAVLFSTIRGFKGLEADAVIMLDVPRPDSAPYFTKTDFYVGTSRAKHLLAVLPTEEGVMK